MGHLEDCEPNAKPVQDDIAEIKEIEPYTSGKLTWKEFFSNGRAMNFHRASAGVLSQAFQQIGMSGVALYGSIRPLTPFFVQVESTWLHTTPPQSSKPLSDSMVSKKSKTRQHD